MSTRTREPSAPRRYTSNGAKIDASHKTRTQLQTALTPIADRAPTGSPVVVSGTITGGKLSRVNDRSSACSRLKKPTRGIVNAD